MRSPRGQTGPPVQLWRHRTTGWDCWRCFLGTSGPVCGAAGHRRRAPHLTGATQTPPIRQYVRAAARAPLRLASAPLPRRLVAAHRGPRSPTGVARSMCERHGGGAARQPDPDHVAAGPGGGERPAPVGVASDSEAGHVARARPDRDPPGRVQPGHRSDEAPACFGARPLSSTQTSRNVGLNMEDLTAPQPRPEGIVEGDQLAEFAGLAAVQA